MAFGNSPRSRRQRLGEELRKLREAKGYTMLQIVGELGWSHTKLSRLETAKVRPDVGDVMDLLEALGVTGDPERRLIKLARQANQRAWWLTYHGTTEGQVGLAEVEADTAEIWEYAMTYVPGLLQTERYARVRFTDHPYPVLHIDEAVRFRLDRQRVLTADEPVTYGAVLDESVFRRVAAPADVWREQCAHLVEMAALPNVTLRVLPFAAVLPHHFAPMNSFSMYRFREPDDPDIVGVETESSYGQLGGDKDLARYRVIRQRLTDATLGEQESLALIHEEASR